MRKSWLTSGFNLSLILLFTFFAACNPGSHKADEQLKNLHWLAGTWQLQSEAGTLTETWAIKNGNALAGKTYLVDQNDTIFTETISIEVQNGAVYYVPVIPDQNQGKGIRFKLISNKEQTCIFENKSHDFPQRISYRQNGENGLTAWIEGAIKGKVKSEEFNFRRVK